MVDFLVEFHFDKGFRLYCVVGPADIPVEGVGSFLFLPPEVLGHFAHHWILAIYFKSCVPDVLMTIFCFTLVLPFFSFFLEGEGDISFADDSESDSYYLESFIYAVKS